MNIEVGKTYLSRDGARVKIVEDTKKDKYPMCGREDGVLRYYNRDGRFVTERTTEMDLVAEAPSE